MWYNPSRKTKAKLLHKVSLIVALKNVPYRGNSLTVGVYRVKMLCSWREKNPSSQKVGLNLASRLNPP